MDPFIQVNNASEAAKRKKETTRIRMRARTTFSRYALAEEEVLRMEEELGIEERWLPGSPEYAQGIEELGCRKYRLALDHLERLVIQRMFELTKLGMSGIGTSACFAGDAALMIVCIGYKLREKIGKALRTRAEAIRNALAEYNRCAAALKPPRVQLGWNDIMEMASLAEFDLLRDAREDVREYPWAQRLHRQAMSFHFNVKRAREEVDRLNVEIPRLFTYMVDRHYDLKAAIASAKETNPALAYELELRWDYEDRVSTRIAARLYETSQLVGFTGTLAAGHRVGREPVRHDDIALPSWACHAGRTNPAGADSSGGAGPEGEQSDAPDKVEDEGIPGVEDEGDAVRLVDFIDGLA